MSEKNNIVKEYTNGEVTVVWKPGVCIHSENCFHGLPAVFNPNQRPWIKAEAADTQVIVDQVKKCPSGALSFYMNGEEKQEEVTAETEQIIEVVPNGPLLVYGSITIKKQDGIERRNTPKTGFCRCGSSNNKPFCDGTHRKIGFVG